MSRFKRAWTGLPFIRQAPGPGPAAPGAPGLAVSPNVIHVQYRPRRRAIVGSGLQAGDGIAGPAPVTLGSPGPPRPFVARSPAPRRAVTGNAMSCGDGVAAPVSPAAPAAAVQPPRLVPRRAPARAHTGSLGLVAAGIASVIVTQRGSPSSPAPRPVIQHLPGRRAVTGNSLSCGDGIASQAVTPLGSVSSPAPRPVIQHLAARRALTGNSLLCGDGVASQTVTPLGAPSRPKPFVFRSPAPRRAIAGNNLACGDGGASPVSTPLGAASRPKPFTFRSPLPRRALAGPAGTCGTGFPGFSSTPAVLIQSATGTDTTFASSVSATFPLGNAGGNTILLAWEGDTGTAGSANTPTDTAGNTYTRLLTRSLASAFDLEIWVAYGINAGPNTVTVTDTIGGSDGILIVQEWAGLTRATDGSASATGSSSTLSAGAFTTTQPSDLIWAAGVENVAANDLTPAAGYRNAAQAHTAFSNLSVGGQVGPPGSYNGGFTSSVSPAGWVTAAVALVVTPSATASRPKPSVARGLAPRRALAGNSGLCGDGIAVQPPFNFAGASTVTEYTCLPDTTMIGLWEVLFGSVAEGGCTQITDDASLRGVLQHKPKVSTSAGQTFSALTTGPSNGPGNFTFQIQMRTVAQLRTGSAPNNWETAWVFWDFSFPGSLTNCYYYTIKEAGTEFGRLNLGVQTILATTGNNLNPALWHTVTVTVTGNTHAVTVDGTPDITFTDTSGSALTTGQIAAYCEDSQAVFANWSLTIATAAPVRPYVFRSPAPHRAVTGNSLACGDGVASRSVTPLGTPSFLRPAIQRAAPRRALIPGGNTSTPGGGIASRVSTPLGAVGPRLPLEARSPAPRRALTRGLASPVSTPRGAAGPKLPPQARRPAPSRARWGGVTGPANAVPPAATPARPAPVRPAAPRRVLWRGLASQAVTPRGALGPPKPFVARKPSVRAVTGHGGVAGGVRGPVNPPAGSPSSPAPRPVIQHLPQRRAVTGFLGRNAGGYPGHNACPAFPLAGPYVYQSMLVPAYSYPNPPTFWNLLLAAVPPVKYVVANVSSGPGVTADPNYTAVISAALAAGLTVLGYVDTNYAAVPAATADANVGLWQSLYGVTSIFFDRSSALIGDEPYYAARTAVVRSTPGAITALNFGTIPDSGYMASADIAVVFEGDYATGWQTFTPAGWMAGYNPSRFCVLVANAQTTAQMQSVLVTAKTDGIGVVYVTPEPSPPTYGVWPGNQYCPTEAAQINADNAVAAIGRPVIQHLPPQRAQAGPLARAPGAGYASRVSTPRGSPSSPAPRPVIQHLPARRAIGHGLASAVVTPLGAIAPLRMVPLFPPRITRARVGSGTVSGGIASSGVTPPPPASSPFPSAPGIARPGLASPGMPPGPGPVPGSAPYLPAASLARRSPAPRRALTGSSLQPAGGIASRVSTPLGTPPRPDPFVFRSPAPRRAALGRSLTCAGGLASQAVTPLGIPSRPKPFIWRSPAPHRALTGPRAALAGGPTGVTTPLGLIAPPRLLLPWASRPRTRAVAGHGPVAGGVASRIVTPLGSPPIPALRPVIQHLPPRRASAGLYGRNAGGVASRLVTPLGAAGPPHPFVARKGPARAVLGSQGRTGAGIASGVSTPPGTPPVSVVRPVIVHVPPVRAHTGPAGRNAGGNPALTAITLAATAYQHAPRRPASAVPARARTGPLGGNAGGNPAPSPVIPAAVTRKPAGSRSTAPARAHLGSLGRNAGGVLAAGTVTAQPLRRAPAFRSPPRRRALAGGITSRAVTPLGTIAPARIRQPWASRPRTRAIAGPGTVAGGHRAGPLHPPPPLALTGPVTITVAPANPYSFTTDSGSPSTFPVPPQTWF